MRLEHRPCVFKQNKA